MKKKKMLFISAIQVFPAESGGQLRSAHLTRSFSELGYDVRIFSLTGRKEDYLNRRPSGEQILGPSLKEFTHRGELYGFLQWLCYRLGLPPLWLVLIRLLGLPRALKTELVQADFVMIDFPYLYPMKSYFKGPFYVNTHNAEFELVAEGRPFLKALVKKIELKGIAAADQVLFCNDNDRQVFAKLTPADLTKFHLLPNGVDPQSFAPDQGLREKTRRELGISDEQKVFLFTGSQYAPNKEAFSYLEEFYKTHQFELSRLNLVVLVVGTVCPEMRNEPHFKVMGRVDSMKGYFLAADFGLNPIQLGSGTNVKMIEFLAARLPILSTPFGARGLSFEDQKSIYYFDRTNLLSTMEQAGLRSQAELTALTTQAWNSNHASIDMKEALRSLEISW